MENILKNWNNLKEYLQFSAGGILSKEIAISENADVTVFSMSSGTKISEHTSSKEGFVMVIEGNGIFNLEGEEILLEPGVLINLKKNMKHSLSAIKNLGFVLILIK